MQLPRKYETALRAMAENIAPVFGYAEPELFETFECVLEWGCADEIVAEFLRQSAILGLDMFYGHPRGPSPVRPYAEVLFREQRIQNGWLFFQRDGLTSVPDASTARLIATVASLPANDTPYPHHGYPLTLNPAQLLKLRAFAARRGLGEGAALALAVEAGLWNIAAVAKARAESSG